MKSKGNGSPQQCMQNLLRIARGEVPYERLKGIDTKLIGKPATQVTPELVADVEWSIRTYEPRVIQSSADLIAAAAQAGQFGVQVTARILREGDESE